MIKKGLGRGLSALIDAGNTDEAPIMELKINEIEPNMGQPRKNFNDEKLDQLAESIRQHGIVQPIIVKKEKNSYTIVAGERRWRAARLAGLTSVPVVVKDISSKQVMEIALIENLQREDLNPMEEAEAYEKLLKEFNMTQEDVARTVGKSRPAVANSLRLLNLCDAVKKLVVSGELSSGHARTLITISDVSVQESLAMQIAEKELSVRETEKLIKRLSSEKPVQQKEEMTPEHIEIEEKLRNIFGTKVRLISNDKSGKIMIEYYSNDELDRILEMLDLVSEK